MTEDRSNWAGSYSYTAEHIYHPTSVEEIQQLVSKSNKVRALGSRHSFNGIADSPGELIALDQMPRVLEFSSAASTVTVDAGIRYGQVARVIDAAGFALHNLASLPHISVAGAVATATHGSGDENGNLATAVIALEFVAADGSLVTLSRAANPDQFPGAVVNLGGLGIVTKLTLKVSPTFQMRQNLYERLPFDQLIANFDAIERSAYSVSLFTAWAGDYVDQVWLKRQVSGEPFEAAPDLFGALPAPDQRHPIPGLSGEACTQQMGVPGPWYERMPHFRMDFTPSSGEELQAEYLVPRQNAVAALQVINSLRERIAPLIHTSEIRTIAADDLWMSPCYEQPCVGIHFTWKKDWAAVSAMLPVIQEQLAPFNPRPHWGKLFTTPGPEVQAQYPRVPDFRKLLQTYDPSGKHRNTYLDTYVF